MLGGNSFFTLKGDTFQNNFASIAAGAIYFNYTVLIESPRKNNIFIGNKAAIYADDYCTFPLRVICSSKEDNNLTKSKKDFVKFDDVIPGMTLLQMNFSVVDYYGQIIKTLNETFLFFLIFGFIYEIKGFLHLN